MIQPDVAADGDALLRAFIKIWQSFTADQYHLNILLEDLQTGIAQHVFCGWIHFCDAQIGGQDDDALFEIIGNPLLNGSDVTDFSEVYLEGDARMVYEAELWDETLVK